MNYITLTTAEYVVRTIDGEIVTTDYNEAFEWAQAYAPVYASSFDIHNMIERRVHKEKKTLWKEPKLSIEERGLELAHIHNERIGGRIS